MERLKLSYIKNQRLINLIQYMVFSVFLIIAVYILDFRLVGYYVSIPDIFTTSIDLSITILSTLAGALLTITTFTFTTVLSVVSIYVSNYSPYVIPNFVNQPIVMKVLGVFLGGFLYNIVSLALMRDFNLNRQVISGMIGIIYALVCVVYFVQFVMSMINYSQDSNIMKEIYKQVKKTIDTELKEREQHDENVKTTFEFSIPLHAQESGYYSVLDNNEFMSGVGNLHGQIVVSRRIGEFVAYGSEIAKLYIFDTDIEKDDINIDKIENAFIFAEDQITQNNYRFGLNKLTEIALRSSGSNAPDNETIIHAIHQLGLLLSTLAQSKYSHTKKNKSENMAIFNSSYSFEDDMYDYFSKIIHKNADDMKVINALFDSYRIIYENAVQAHKYVVEDFANYTIEFARDHFTKQRDLDKLDEIYKFFQKIEEDN